MRFTVSKWFYVLVCIRVRICESARSHRNVFPRPPLSPQMKSTQLTSITLLMIFAATPRHAMSTQRNGAVSRTPSASVANCTASVTTLGYWRQRAHDRPPPKVPPGAYSEQRQGWKTPKGPSGGSLLLYIYRCGSLSGSPWDEQVRRT